MGLKNRFKNIILYWLDCIENAFYEEVLNEYGSKHATRGQVMKYVKKLRAKLN